MNNDFGNLKFASLAPKPSHEDWQVVVLMCLHMAAEGIRLGLNGDFDGANCNVDMAQGGIHSVMVGKEKTVHEFIGTLLEEAVDDVTTSVSKAVSIPKDASHPIASKIVNGVFDIALNRREFLELLMEWKLDD